MTLPTFQLTAPTSQAAAPFTVGHAFKAGDVPTGQQLVAGFSALQVVPKNLWPDGSLKFALISGRAALTANVPLSVALSIGTPTGGTALTTADLRATGVTAAMGAGAFGTASWATTDWDAPFQSWVSGPQMSSWIYRKQIGSDAHLAGWLEVRLYAGGAVEILPWVENGYVMVAGPTNKNATYTFTMGGTQRFTAAIDLPNHTRTPLVSGSSLSHWLGADPAVTPSHDHVYTNSTRQTPAYGAVASETVIARQVQTYTPMQQGNYSPAMGTAGYDPSIGLLPEWDAAYLSSGDARAWRGLVLNGYSAGRFGIHFRDETTLRPIKFSDYPNLVLDGSSGIIGVGTSSTGQTTPTASGTIAPQWITTHHPSVGFAAYLVTGRFYFMEQVQFAATVNYLKCTDIPRGYSGGIFITNAGSNTTRGAAWAIRTLVQAASATPDADALHAEFINSVAANVNHYHSNFIARTPQPNNFGILIPFVNYTTGYYSISSWQNDFFTAAAGYGLSLNLPLSSGDRTKFSEFFAWKAKFVIGRLGPVNDLTAWPYVDAAAYYIPASPNEAAGGADWYDPTTYYPSWRAMYEKTDRINNGTDTNLRGGYFPDATAYWGNMQPAIAYAVEHGVTGATEAYARMTGAPNFYQLQADFPNAPEWAIVPHDYIASEVITTTPGPSFVWDAQSLVPGAFVWDTYRGLGIPGADAPAGSLLANDVSGSDPAGTEYRVSITPPTAGTFIIGNLSDFQFTAPDGVYTGPETVYKNGAGDPGSYSFTIGIAPEVTGVTLSPSSATVSGGATQQFTPTVSGPGSPSQAVNYTLTDGSITAGGLFTGPPTTSVVQMVYLTATSAADPTKSVTIAITIPAASSVVTGVVVSPDGITVTGGGTLKFTGVVNGGGIISQALTWSSAAGSMVPDGTWAIPAATDTLQSVTITGRSVQDPTKSGTATVYIAAIATVVVPPPVLTLPDPTPAPSLATRSLSWLKQAVENWTHRPGFAADPVMDDFIMLAEKRINEDLDARLQDVVATIPAVNGLNGVLIPADVAEIRSLSVAGHGPLGYITPDQFNDEFANGTPGLTRFYTIIGPYIYLGPTPDANYSLTCAYRQHIPSLLDAADGVNWLIRDQPNIYLAAVMCEALVYVQNETQIPTWEGKYKLAVDALNQADWHTGGPLTVKSDTLH